MLSFFRRLFSTIFLVFVFVGGFFVFSHDAFAAWGDENVKSGKCKSGTECWSAYANNGGGLVWIFYSGTEISSFRNITGMQYPSSASGDVNASTAKCTKPGIYFLAALWHKSDSTELTGKIFGPKEQGSVKNWEQQVRTEVSLDLDADAGYSLFTGDAYDAYQKSGNPLSAWGNLSWFCAEASPQPPAPPATTGCPLKFATDPGSGSETRGTAISYSGIRSSVWSTYDRQVYAKPNDKFNWAHCYYREEQQVQFTMYQNEDTAFHNQVQSAIGSGTFNHHPPHSDTVTAPGFQHYVVTDVPGYSNNNTGSIVTDAPTKIFPENLTFSIDSIRYNSLSVNNAGKITGTQKKNGASTVYSGSSGQTKYTYTVQPARAGLINVQRVTSHIGTNSVAGHTYAGTWTGHFEHCAQECTHITCNCPTPPATGSCSACHSCDDWHSESGNVNGYHTTVYLQEGQPKTSATNDSSRASIYVPYNFSTSVSTTISQGITQDNDSHEQIVMANDKVDLTAIAAVTTRYNSKTKGDYATETLGGEIKWISFYLRDTDPIPDGSTVTSDPCSHYGSSVINCELLDSKSGPFNVSGNMGGESYFFAKSNVTIKNVPAGYRYCTAIGMTPTNSGADDNGVTPVGNGYFKGTPTVNNAWHVSSPTCRTVASVPNIQVWGGNMANSGTVTTSVAKKPSINRFFGSWAEFAIVNNGKITNLTSGAANAYARSYDEVLGHTHATKGTIGGTLNNSYNHAALTLPNSPCYAASDHACSTIATKSGISVPSSVVDRIRTRYQNPNFCANSPSCEYHTETSIPSRTITEKGRTVVYYSSDDIYITGNLDITKGPFTSADEVSNFVIISDKNIHVNQYVSTVNAWLIAKGFVDTCNGTNISAGSVNNTACGQLTINGLVVADSLQAKRGGGGGAQESSENSGSGIGITYSDTFNTEPAEKINLSVSSYLWAYAEAKRSTEAHTVYMRTLAPRL